MRVPMPSASIQRPAEDGLIGAGLSALPGAGPRPSARAAMDSAMLPRTRAARTWRATGIVVSSALEAGAGGMVAPVHLAVAVLAGPPDHARIGRASRLRRAQRLVAAEE